MWCTLGCFSWTFRLTMISRLRSHSGLVLHLYFLFHGLQPDDSLRALRVYRLVSIPTVFTRPLPKQIIGQSKCPHHASVDPCVHLGLLLVYTTQRALLFLSSETIRGTHILSVLFFISFPFQLGARFSTTTSGVSNISIFALIYTFEPHVSRPTYVSFG